MAYKFSKGTRGLGDITFEDDADTGIDFEADTIKLETGGAERLVVTNTGVGINTGSPVTLLHINGTTDSSLSNHGLLVLGPTNSTNMTIDQNEIIARNNGAESTLYLQASGGGINLGNTAAGKGVQIDSDGYLKFHQGVKYSRGVQVNTINMESDDSPDLRWIKIARTHTAGYKFDTSSSTFLVHTAGYETSDNRSVSGMWLIHVKYTPAQHETSGEHADPDGTWITAEALHANDLHSWDPTTNLAVTFDQSWTTGNGNQAPHAEIWFKTPVKDKEIFVTHLGGTGVNNASGFTGPGFGIQSGQDWVGSRTDLGSNGVGTKAQIVLTIGAGGGSDSTMPVDGSTMTIGTIYRTNNAATMIVRFTSGGTSNTVWVNDGASGNIDLTIHTDDVNTNDCQKIADRIQSALLGLQTQHVNNVVMYNHDIITGGTAGARTVTIIAEEQWSGSQKFTIAKDVVFTYADSGDSNSTLAGVPTAGTPPNVFMGIWASKKLGNLTSADITADAVKTDKLSASGTGITVSSPLKVESALHVNVRDVSSTGNILTTDHVLRCIQGGAITLTLPAKSGNTGQVLIFKDMNGNANSNNITLDGNGGDTIDGSATYVINAIKESVTLTCDGINGWMITSRVVP